MVVAYFYANFFQELVDGIFIKYIFQKTMRVINWTGINFL